MANSGRGRVAHRAIAAELRDALAANVYADGRRLPTEAELAAQHQVSRQTVRRAMQDLVAEGYVYRVPGSGTFATDGEKGYPRQLGSINDLLNLSLDTQLEVIVPLQRRVDVDAASRLRLGSDSVYALAFRRLHHGQPVCYTSTFLPPEIGNLLSDIPELSEIGATTPSTVIGLVETRMNEPIVAADQSITVGSVPPDAATHIACEPGRPVLRIDRVYFANDERPIELAINWYNPDVYTYRVRLSRGRS